MRPRLLMDFTLRCVMMSPPAPGSQLQVREPGAVNLELAGSSCCVRIFPGVNSRAGLVTLAPGLRPERRFAPLARG